MYIILSISQTRKFVLITLEGKATYGAARHKQQVLSP